MHPPADREDVPEVGSGRPPLEAGLRVGKYVLTERIARGGMAEVWAASVEGPQGFEKPVAIKFILESAGVADEEYYRLFFNEARVASRLHHGNLVSILDFDRGGRDAALALRGRYYIVMERIEGTDLARFAHALEKAGRTCPVTLALFIAGEVLKGLAHIHGRRFRSQPLGLVHRDVSPQNVLVAYSGEVKLSDFGIARSTDAGNGTTGIRGKPQYLAPELLDGVSATAYSDQFAVGLVLWELLAGRRLFDGRTDAQVLYQVSLCEVPPLGEGTLPEVEQIVRRMLARRPEDRFPTTDAALSAILGAPGYKADGRPLGELLASLFPDPYERWLAPPSSTTDAGPVQHDLAPQPLGNDAAVAVDVEAQEAMAVCAEGLADPLFERIDPQEWVRWWKQRGLGRHSELFSPGETQYVPRARR